MTKRNILIIVKQQILQKNVNFLQVLLSKCRLYSVIFITVLKKPKIVTL
jgi:hypothetical protein